MPTSIETINVMLPSISRDDFLGWLMYCTELDGALGNRDDVLMTRCRPQRNGVK